MWWLEEAKCSLNDGDVYIEIDKFMKICNELNVQVSDRLLEVYEKQGLLCPRYRINRPKDYLQKIFEQNHGPDRSKNVIEVPDEFGSTLIALYRSLLFLVFYVWKLHQTADRGMK